MNSVEQMGRRTRTAAFSMVELLVVIGIIALLAAIIFPVFATIRENGRQTSSMSNMHDISTKLEYYRLDTHHYPPVLFGFAVPSTSNVTGPFAPMDKALDTCTTLNTCTTYLTGLYPEYVNNIATFQDPNNSTDDLSKTATLNKLFLCAGNNDQSDDNACPAATTSPAVSNAGVLVLANGTNKDGSDDPHTYYIADAYDISPRVIDGSNTDDPQSGGGDYIVRYDPSWTSIDSALDCGTTPPGVKALAESFCGSSGALTNDYLHQLRWRNPPGESYVTSTTYHTRLAGKILVLTQDGSTKKIDASKYAALEPTGSVSPPNGYGLTVDANGVSSGKFWLVTP
jgi:type II secretory pathway pseudopilin PulG